MVILSDIYRNIKMKKRNLRNENASWNLHGEFGEFAEHFNANCLPVSCECHSKIRTLKIVIHNSIILTALKNKCRNKISLLFLSLSLINEPDE